MSLYGGGHNHTGIMGTGDTYLSPFEIAKLGYQTPTIVNYNQTDYSISDYSSRSSLGEILQVPINGTNQFFLIANRRTISQYDKPMLGDTAKGNPFTDVQSLGKGVYIYHQGGGYVHGSGMDIECADGLFGWYQSGLGAPDWDLSNNWLPILKKSYVSYNNEIPCVSAFCPQI